MCLVSMSTRNKKTIYSLALWARLSVWLLSITCWDCFHSLSAPDLAKEGDSSVRRSLAPPQTVPSHPPLWGRCRSQTVVRWQHNIHLIYCSNCFNWVKSKIKQKGVVKEWLLRRPSSTHDRHRCFKTPCVYWSCKMPSWRGLTQYLLTMKWKCLKPKASSAQKFISCSLCELLNITTKKKKKCGHFYWFMFCLGNYSVHPWDFSLLKTFLGKWFSQSRNEVLEGKHCNWNSSQVSVWNENTLWLMHLVFHQKLVKSDLVGKTTVW